MPQYTPTELYHPVFFSVLSLARCLLLVMGHEVSKETLKGVDLPFPLPSPGPSHENRTIKLF